MMKYDNFRISYMGLAPAVVSMGILIYASFLAVLAKKTYLLEARQQERREFFKSIDWSQPEKITDK